MANDILKIMPKILATGLEVLRSRVLMTRLVNIDYSTEAKKKGQTVDVPISQARTVSDVTPAPTPPAPEDTTIEYVQIPLNNWKKADFGLTDADLQKIAAKEFFIPKQMEEAFEALARAINQSVFNEYKGIYGFTGTPGTTPFASDVSAATSARKVLNQQRAFKYPRFGVLDWDAEANALALPQFSDAEKVGSNDVKIQGEIGRKFGIDWVADDDVPTHTAGTASGYLVNQSDHEVGDTTVQIDTGSGTILEGDIFTVAGDSQTYVVKSYASNIITYTPAAKTAFANNAALTFKDSHVVNIVAHRDAFALAMRQPDAGLKEVYNEQNAFTMADPVSGLVFRLELIRQYKQLMWEVDAMWGTKLVDARLAARIAG